MRERFGKPKDIWLCTNEDNEMTGGGKFSKLEFVSSYSGQGCRELGQRVGNLNHPLRASRN